MLSYLDNVIIGVNVEEDTERVILEYEKKLGISIDFSLLESRISRLVNSGNENYIKSVAISFDNRQSLGRFQEWGDVVLEEGYIWKSVVPVIARRKSGIPYSEGQQVIEEAGTKKYVFEVFSITRNGISGEGDITEWPADLGGTIEDNDIVWKNVGDFTNFLGPRN